MTSDIKQLEESVLQSITDSLKSLKQGNGFIKDDSFWNAKVLEEGNISKKRKKISSSPNNLEEMEAIKSTLLILVESCERKLETIRSTQGTASDRQEGIMSLSNAILANIFKFANSEYDDENLSYSLSPSLKISHVCSRFRAVALATPSLWSLLSTEQPLGYVKECVKRTGNSGLSIWIYIDFGAMRPGGFHGFSLQEQMGLIFAQQFLRKKPKEVKSFLDIVCGHSRRWTSLHYLPCKYADGPSILACIAYFSALDLPNLETFDFSVYLKTYDEFPKKDLSRNLKMPKLRTLRLNNVFITKASQFHSSKTITTFDLTWNRCDGNQSQRPNLPALVDFLSSLPNLVDVRLDMNFDENEATVPTENFLLPKLERLDVDLVPSAFRNFVHGMQSPVLKTLVLHSGYVDEIVDAIFPDAVRSVQELTIKAWAHANSGSDLCAVFEKFSHLEHLELVAEHASFPKFNGLGDPPMAMPPLRSLAIETNASVTKEFVPAFVNALKESGRWETFETFKLKWDDGKGIPVDLKNLVEQGKQVINVGGNDSDDDDSDDDDSNGDDSNGDDSDGDDK